jgi:multidrug efflux pump subunit AcrB
MKITEYFVASPVVSWLLASILLVAGIASYNTIGRLEDPAFTLKTAMVVTHYPGASPEEVETEITKPIESAIQLLPYVDYVRSISSAGLSQVIVEMKGIYRKDDLQQIWDELRRKVHDLRSTLPPGATRLDVLDDFGDVYGILMTVSGANYSYDELKDYVDYLRRELVLVEGVGKVSLAGLQQEQVQVEISRGKLSSLGIEQERIYQLLSTQSNVANAGSLQVGGEQIRLHSSGKFESIEELEKLLVSKPGSSELVYLGDVANVTRAYAEIPQHIINYNLQPALLLGVSFSPGVDVVKIGEAIDTRMAELKRVTPLGIKISHVYNQPKEVAKSMRGFILSLVQAVVIVIVVLLIFMGIKSGLLIGAILVITVFGSLIFMRILDIELHRMSLGALIIALGMLVDNAIVVTEGVLVGIKRGNSAARAGVQTVRQTGLPLLGATAIAITAFAPISLSSHQTGEFASSLFWVLLISLLLSWVTAITLTPFFATLLFKEKSSGGSKIDLVNEKDIYKGVIFNVYKGVLVFCMRYRRATLLGTGALFIIATIGFSQAKQAFFPSSNTPIFYLEYWRYQGSDIRETQKDIEAIQAYLLERSEVEHVTSTVGQGTLRFKLSYSPENVHAGFGQLIVRLDRLESINPVMGDVRQYMSANFPQAEFKIRGMSIGPATDSKIEVRFSGAEPDQLRALARQAIDVLRADGRAYAVRHNWRQPSKVIRPQFNEAMGRRIGITKQDLDQMLLTRLSGAEVGVYRDGSQLLPIVAKAPKAERENIDSLYDLNIYSRLAGAYVPIDQVVTQFKIDWENALIIRRDRKRTITVSADHDILGDETATELFQRVRQKIESIDLPLGYSMAWGGEYESARDAQKAIFGGLPFGFLLMFIVTVLLFNSLKTPVVIWATVPLALIGVTAGLYIMQEPFGFMSLLGLLSLSGMLLKNGIVLVDQIQERLSTSINSYVAVFESAVSRVRPVMMAALTTILGMIPLLFDPFFSGMAVTIMFGLAFATLLTLIVVPVLFSVVYRIPYHAEKASES